jgi:Flp pilus assembly protein TadG
MMVSVLLVFLLFAVLQVAAVFYVKSVVAAGASDGARYAANADVDAAAGAPRASRTIGQALGAGMARRVPCSGREVIDDASSLATAQVTCRGRIRSVFVPLGVFVTIDVTAQSLKEHP